MAIKFSKNRWSLDKNVWKIFASFPDVEKKVEFPEEKKEGENCYKLKEAKEG